MIRIKPDIIWVGVSGFIQAIILLTIQALLVRSVPIVDFGVLILAQLVISLIETTFVVRSGEVALYWITRGWNTDFPLTRSYSLYLVRQEAVWNISIYLFILISAWPISRILDIPVLWLAILGLAIPVQIGYGVSKSIFIASGRLRLQSQFEIATNIIYLILVFILIKTYSIFGFMWATVLISLIKTVVAYTITRSLWPSSVLTRKPIAPSNINLSAHSIFRNLFRNIATQADVLILGILSSKEIVAFYKLAKTLANIPLRIAPIVWNVLRPQLINAFKERNEQHIRHMILLPGGVFAVTGIVAIIFAAISADWLISLVYGPKFINVKFPFILLLAGTWYFYAVTGWLDFIVILSKSKIIFSRLLLLHAILVIFGVFFGQGNLNETAMGVAIAMFITSVLTWWILLQTNIVVDSFHGK